MPFLDVVRRALKKRLRLPVRQTQAYLRSLFDGSFRLIWARPSTSAVDSDSFKRKIVLVLDAALPMKDRDAGSRTTYEFVACLIALGYQVHFWPIDGLDIPQYTAQLRQLGVKVLAGYFRPSLKAWLARWKGEVGSVLLNRPEVAVLYLDILRMAGVPIVYYGHDLHFARLDMEASRNSNEELIRRAEKMRRLERSIWRRVNVSTYPSEDEVVTVHGLEPDVAARALLAFCYDSFSQRCAAPAGSDIMFVGSFRHPPNVQAAKFLAEEVFPLVREAVPMARLVIAGAYVTDEIRGIEGNGIHVAGWVSDQELESLYTQSRLSIVPLQVGAGMKLKVVEALANGIPLVTTSVGAQGLSAIGEILPIHDSATDIAQAAIHMLQLDDAAWLQQSHVEIAYAKANFSREAMKRSLVEALDLAARTRPLE